MYLYGFVLPYHRDRLGTLASAEQMVAKNDLHAIADPLRSNSQLRVFANHNDFLTSDDDVAWLTELVGAERVRFFPTGGHLGNLHRPEVQAEVMASLEDLVEAAPAPGGATSWQCGDLRVATQVERDSLRLSGPFGVRTLTGLPSASGARYGDVRATEFWEKADEAMLILDGERQPDCRKSAQPSPWDEARARGIGFRAIGNEPGWLVEVGSGEAPALHAELDFGSRRLELAHATATSDGWKGETADGTSLVLTIQREACRDSMSDHPFPASAVLRVGASTHRGCGRFLFE
jgi:uncharacterized membrane protein